VYLWPVHDFKSYDIFACWSIHGLSTCLICCLDTNCFHHAHGGKICYFDCHRHWFPYDHIFRQQKNTFKNDNIVTKGSQKRLNGLEIVDMLDKMVLNKNGDWFVGYGVVHNRTHICGDSYMWTIGDTL
jgi:hypothetical protein